MNVKWFLSSTEIFLILNRATISTAATSMDPLSIFIGSVTLATTLCKTCEISVTFVRGLKSAPEDMNRVTAQMVSLHMNLTTLSEALNPNLSSIKFPDAVLEVIKESFCRIERLLAQLEKAIEECKCSKLGSRIKWNTETKHEVTEIRKCLQEEELSLQFVASAGQIRLLERLHQKMQELEGLSDAANNDNSVIRAEIKKIQVDLDIMPDKLDINGVKAMIAEEAAVMRRQLETLLDQNKETMELLTGLRSTCETVENMVNTLVENQANNDKALIVFDGGNKDRLIDSETNDSKLSADNRSINKAWLSEQPDLASKLYCTLCQSN